MILCFSDLVIAAIKRFCIDLQRRLQCKDSSYCGSPNEIFAGAVPPDHCNAHKMEFADLVQTNNGVVYSYR